MCVGLGTFDLWAHLSEVLEGELVAGLGQLLDDLSDSVSGQRQVGSSEQLRELVLTDEAVVVHVCRRRGQRSTEQNTITLLIWK